MDVPPMMIMTILNEIFFFFSKKHSLAQKKSRPILRPFYAPFPRYGPFSEKIWYPALRQKRVQTTFGPKMKSAFSEKVPHRKSNIERPEAF